MLKKEINSTIVYCLIMGVFLLSCKNFSQMKEYKFNTGATCAPGYGIHLYTGIFKSKEGSIIPIYDITLDGPWGAGGSSNVIGDGFEQLPDRLKVGFYSETEDKFFEGEFDLPYNELEKLFEEENEDPFYKDKTFDDTQSGKILKYMKYDELSIGITLGGVVTVWVSGQQSRIQKEIANFKVNEVEVNWRDVFENGERAESIDYNMNKIFSAKVKNEITSKTLPFTLWNTYKEKYNWRYKVQMPSGGKIDYVYVNMINAEQESKYNNSPTLDNDPYTLRTIPYNVEMKLHDQNGKRYIAWIVFTESIDYLKNIYKGGSSVNKYPDDFRNEEIFKVFQTLDKSKPIEINYSIDSAYKDIKITIKQESKEIPLSKVTVWLMDDN
jgi:Protein of unknown function (DUF2931)